MASAVSSIASQTTAAAPASTSTGTIRGMTASDFLNLMIEQLAHQDPLNPTDSNQLLNQMAQISTLQSNSQMQTSLSGLTLQQSIGAGGNLIGKHVQGLSDNNEQVDGIVTSIKVENKKVFLELETGKSLAMENVTGIAMALPAAGLQM